MPKREKIPSPIQLRLLDLLLAKEKNGQEILTEYEREYGAPLSIGTVYTTLSRMVEAKWLTARVDSDEDGRFRWFKSTAKGRDAAEKGRLYYTELGGGFAHVS